MGPHTTARTIIATLFLVFGLPWGLSAQTVVWNPNTEPDIAGYRLFYGTVSRQYTHQVDVGNKTSHAPTGVDWSRPMFFAVQAYSTTGLKSPLSAEAQWIPPANVEVADLRASVGYPLLMGKPVTWTALMKSTSTPVEYKFYMYRKTGWVLVRDWSPSNTYTWTPTWDDQGGPYHVQVWARKVGSTADYESWRGTEAFTVMTAAMDVKADVDFPTPLGNTVTWTARVAGSDRMSLEYKFWVFSQATGQWQVLREYAFNDQAPWTPPANGQYAVQAWARRSGSTAAYDTWAGSGFITVKSAPIEITAFSADTTFPAPTGKPITWTVRVRGGLSGPLQYQYWIYSESGGWRVGQPWGLNKTFTWTPSWTDTGKHAVQVWVRSNNSKAAYEAWTGSGYFEIRRLPLHLTTTKYFPVAPGTIVDWLAETQESSTANLEYQFWLFTGATGNWSVAKPYSTQNTFDWTPLLTGTYAVQAWARQRGSSNPYDIWRGTDFLKVARGPVRLMAFTSSMALPAAAGSNITWTVAASGGTGPLEYQFWRHDAGGWMMVQDYGPSNTFTWSGIQAGKYALQVWVRSAGSKEPYEAWAGTGFFTIQ